MLVVLAGLYVLIAYQASRAADRSACITEYRSTWERSVGDIVVTAAQDQPPTRRQVKALRQVQGDLGRLNELCPR